jgi:hypothetical protein
MMVTMAEIPEFWGKEESRTSWEPEEVLSITFGDWRDEIMAIGRDLETVLGKRVFSHCGRRANKRDDRLHRWLALHYWCSFFPGCDFISYLCEAGGFSSVTALKSALLDPASYSYPFRQEWSYERIAVDRVINFVPSDISKDYTDRVGIVLEGAGALEKAAQIALEAPGAKIFLGDPQNVIDSHWIYEACKNAADYEMVTEIDKLPDLVDELHLVAADSIEHPTEPAFRRVIKLSGKKRNICGHTPARILGLLEGKWPLPKTSSPGDKGDKSRCHTLDNIDLCFGIDTEKNGLIVGTSAEGKRRINEWIKWADEKAYDELAETKTGNWEVMIRRYKATGIKEPFYGCTSQSFTSYFRYLADNVVYMRVFHYSGEILEITSIDETAGDFELLFDLDAYEYGLLDYWMESEVSGPASIEDCEFNATLDGGFGLRKSVKSNKTGDALTLRDYF